MKTFTRLNEQCLTSDVNPGNAMSLGVTNHLTPVDNIVTNVRNYFGAQLGIIVCVAEDTVSLKMHSSRFVSKEEVRKILQNPIQRNMSVQEYITSQGLDRITMMNVGQYWVVYFSPSDVKTAKPGLEATPAELPVKEQLEWNLGELEMESLEPIIIKESEDEEMEDSNKAKIKEILEMTDKVKAAKKLEALIANEMELPREYYFAGVKSNKGIESIALRWKYTKRSGKKETTELTKSLINIYGKEGELFVADFDEKSMFSLPTEVNTLINNIIEFFDAEKTNDKAVFKIKGWNKSDSSSEKKEDEKKDEKTESEPKEDEKSSDKKEENSGSLL